MRGIHDNLAMGDTGSLGYGSHDICDIPKLIGSSCMDVQGFSPDRGYLRLSEHNGCVHWFKCGFPADDALVHWDSVQFDSRAR